MLGTDGGLTYLVLVVTGPEHLPVANASRPPRQVATPRGLVYLALLDPVVLFALVRAKRQDSVLHAALTMLIPQN
ncbi:hypothetical protein ACFWD7_42535 [Streptomyces mirabilis]|uniref:hypothetical protein n=1 Tax=Streptomyces mirabilis TaxID=68239 RepID=UPI0036B3D027